MKCSNCSNTLDSMDTMCPICGTKVIKEYKDPTDTATIRENNVAIGTFGLLASGCGSLVLLAILMYLLPALDAMMNHNLLP